MTKELAELSFQIGAVVSSIIDETADSELGTKLKKAFGDYILSLPKRPDAERAALMLLSAGQELYGEACNDSNVSVEVCQSWKTRSGDAEKLLGIVKLGKAE